MHPFSPRGDFADNARLLRIATIAAVVGALSTVTAYLLLLLIHFFTNLFFYQTVSFELLSPSTNTLGLWVILVPVGGGLIIGLLARFGSEQIRGHGIPEAIEAILFKKSKMSPKIALLKPLSSGIAIGSGGPFGAEGPIIMTGGAVGSLIGQYFHISGAERKTLLVAGACAGMTAVFGTPIAAVMLAVELLLFELRPRSLLPVAIACAVAGFMRPLLLDVGPLFPLQSAPIGMLGLVSCAIAGLAAGSLAWALSSALYKVEDLFEKLPIHWMWWPALGGLVVGIGGYLQPRALGVGYDVIGELLQNHLAIQLVYALLLCKAVMWVVALGSGTSGGVLAPLLMMGAGLGVIAGPWLPGGHPALWPLIFMAATLGGMMRAPIMAVMFALELTHDVQALLPLLTASTVAYGFTVVFMPRSILTEKIARRGYHIYREYGVDPLERYTVHDVMAQSVETIEAQMSIYDALILYFGEQQTRRAFPVVKDGVFVGMVDRDILLAGQQSGLAERVLDLFGANVPVVALPNESCRTVATRMAVHGLERLAVVTDAHAGQLVGIISRSDLIKPSFDFHAQEQEHETVRSTPLANWKRHFVSQVNTPSKM